MLVSNETPAHVRPECNPLVHDYPNPLKIVVIGAGISGLSAAIALRSQGHNVEVSYIPPSQMTALLNRQGL